MQNTKSKTWGARRKGLTLLFLSLALIFFPLSYSFISRTVGMHRNVLYDIMRQVPLLSTQQDMHKQAAIKNTTFCGLQNPRYKLDGVSYVHLLTNFSTEKYSIELTGDEGCSVAEVGEYLVYNKNLRRIDILTPEQFQQCCASKEDKDDQGTR